MSVAQVLGDMAVPGLLIVVGVVLWLRERWFFRRAKRTEGTVIAVRTSTDEHGEESRHARIEFATERGRIVRFRPLRTDDFRVGAKVTVYYHPRFPGQARADPGHWDRSVGAGFIYLGVAVLIVIPIALLMTGLLTLL